MAFDALHRKPSPIAAAKELDTLRRVIEGMKVVDALYSGYGEGPPGGSGPDQGRIVKEGNAYLDKEYPKLDEIVRATIVERSEE